MIFENHSKLAKAPVYAIALSLGLAVAGCGGMPTNTSLYSTKQPVVERNNFALDVQTQSSGLAISEQQRVNGWFEAMNLQYGDRVSIDDPTNNPAFKEAVSDLAGRYGLLVSDTAPTTQGFLQPGQARIVITRSTASVDGCPDWSAKSDMNYNHGTSPGYGCAVNSNFAAMIANPEDLLEGAEGDSETLIATSNKAIDSYRDTAPTGAQGLQNANGGN
jgi:pilus assembly protein CpaD